MKKRVKRPKDAEAVLQRLLENREQIRGYGVRRIGLFGSYTRGEASKSSDLDFIVEFNKKSFDSYMSLKFLLEDLFGTRVDLVISDVIKPRLRPTILNQVLYAPGL
jgi:predicted nucleotidyltransferase